VFRGCEAFRVEQADALHARGVSLPCSVGITAEARARVVTFLADQRR
jgi:dTDP-4-amino-4,6-dideoxygalactose transaminase